MQLHKLHRFTRQRYPLLASNFSVVSRDPPKYERSFSRFHLQLTQDSPDCTNRLRCYFFVIITSFTIGHSTNFLDNVSMTERVSQPCPSSPPTALLLCLGVNVHDSGAGPRNISEIFTQSRLSPLARRVSSARGSETLTSSERCTYQVDRARGREGHGH